MPDVRILGMVSSCGECNNRRSRSGGGLECVLVEQPIVDPSAVALFCPLTRYPAREIAGLERTVVGYRDPYQLSLPTSIIEHVSKKLKKPLNPDGSITFEKKDGTPVTIRWDHITAVETHPGTQVCFVFGGQKFRLSPDVREPFFEEEVKLQQLPEPVWDHHPIR